MTERPTPARHDDWPLVGRDSLLKRVLEPILSSRCHGVVLVGPSGVGKTRLANEALAAARAHGVEHARVFATRAASTIPFGAFAPLLPALNLATPDGPMDRARLLRLSCETILNGASDARFVLFVDDAQLLDDASATVVHQLAAIGSITVLATCVAGASAPDPIRAIWKDGLATRIEVGELPPRDIQQLIVEVLRAPVTASTISMLTERCNGNVLFLREMLLGALEDGMLTRRAGAWQIEGEFAASTRLVELMGGRLGRVSGRARSLLEVLAFGEPLGAHELQAIGTVRVAEDLERRGLIALRLDGRRSQARLGHPVYGDVIRQQTPMLRIPQLARMLAEMTEAHGARRREDILRIGTWRLQGGGGDPDTLLDAAHAARWKYDFPLAEQLTRASIQLRPSFDASLLAAQLAAVQGRASDAERELTGLAEQAHDDAQRGLVAATRLDNLVSSMAQVDAAIVVAEEAAASITNQAWRQELLARRAGMTLNKQGPRAAAAAAAQAIEGATGRASVWASFVAAYSLGRLGRLDAALAVGERGYAEHLQLAEPIEWWYPWFHLAFKCAALAFRGDLEGARAIAEEQYALALESGSMEAQAFFASIIAQDVSERGDFANAERHAAEAIALFRQLGRSMWERVALVRLALAQAQSGRADDAATTMERFEAIQVPFGLYTIDHLIAYAWIHAARGELREARAQLVEAAHAGEQTGDMVGALTALHTLARLGFAVDSRERLAQVADGVEGALAAARVAHCLALADRDGAALTAVADRFEDLGATLLAAEAAADAVQVFRAADDRRAPEAERAARRLVRECPSAATPAVKTMTLDTSLTPAEKHTAILANQNLSNKEIAGRLHLSVRTVENRLQNIYRKLGVSNRGELAELADKYFDDDLVA